MKRIDIIILHIGDVQVTKDCIKSLVTHETMYNRIILVNNDEALLSKKDLPFEKLTILNNKKNVGFAGGVNVGIRYALTHHADGVMLLNNDTVIQKPFLHTLVSVCESNPDIGIVGPAIVFEKNKKRLCDIGGFVNQWTGKTHHKEVTQVKNKTLRNVDYVTGAAMLIKKEVFDTVGFFDEQFFLYYEDADFCIRTRKAGFRIVVCPEAAIYHHLSKTIGKVTPFAVYHQTKSALVFGKKYFPWPLKRILNRLFILLQTLLLLKKDWRGGLAGFAAVKEYVFSQRKTRFVFILAAVSFLVLVSYWRVLFFGFWIDDWYLFWGSLHSIPSTYWYYNHPGLPLEFFVLARVFGTHVMLWQVYAICLKICNAFLVGIFLYFLTQSRKTAVLASFFFAASYAGLEAISSPIMNVAALASIPLLLSFILFIKWYQNRSFPLRYAIGAFAVSVILDPGRVLLSLLLFPFVLTLLSKKKIGVKKSYIFWIGCGALVLITVFAFWFVAFEPSSQIAVALSNFSHHPISILSKFNRVNNLFAAAGNLFVGLLYTMPQNEQNIGIYSGFFSLIGFFFFVGGLGSFMLFRVRKNRSAGILSFFTLWVFLFYFPNWLSEPRAPMAGPHRYLFISSIGFCALVAVVVSKIKIRWLLVGLSLLFIVLNIIKANEILAWQSSYRSSRVVGKIWSTINRGVPKRNTGRLIFMISGKEPWLTQDVLLSSGVPFAVMRNITSYQDIPIITTDPRAIAGYCMNGSFRLSQVYGWFIGEGGEILNDTATKRRFLREDLTKFHCHAL